MRDQLSCSVKDAALRSRDPAAEQPTTKFGPAFCLELHVVTRYHDLLHSSPEWSVVGKEMAAATVEMQQDAMGITHFRDAPQFLAAPSM